MNQIQNLLYGFKTIDLDKLNTVKLMKRYDTKFVFHRDMLTSVFDYLIKDYQLLQIDNDRTFRYENIYYDTDDFFFYHQHHNQKLNRYKLRLRKYIESNQCYFEIKFKNNKKKTIKSRILLTDNNINNELHEESKGFIRKTVIINKGDIVDRLKPSLGISFNRITFANLVNKERLTFDLNLTYDNKVSHPQKINNLIIAELKSERISFNSPYFQYLKTLKISPGKFSKYCMGISLTERNIRCNRFKNSLLKLKKINLRG
jgi:hypothetical protein